MPGVESEEHGAQTRGGALDGTATVTCHYVASVRSNDREARALRRWQLTRATFWLRWLVTWAVFVLAVLVGVALLVQWLAPEASGFFSWAVLLGGAMMLAAVLVDGATLPTRTLRRLQRVVDRRTPVGTTVEQSFSADRLTVTTPISTSAVPTASITRAALLRDCLVLEGHGQGAWVMNGDGIDEHALRIVTDALGERLHRH